MQPHMFFAGFSGSSTNFKVVSHLILVFELVYITRIFSSLRNRGVKSTLIFLSAKVDSFLELIRPHTIWGEHIGLRSTKSPLTDQEIEQIFSWSRDENVLRWSGGTPPTLALEEFRHHLRREGRRPQSDQQLFYIVSKEDGIIGRVGLFTIDWVKLEGEFGILIDQKYWNKRYGREATNLFVKHIFSTSPIRRIYLGTFKDNVRAQHSFMASGFRVIGTTNQFLASEGKEVEGIEMEITRSDFAQA